MIYSASFLGATAIAIPPRTIFGINKFTIKNNSDLYVDRAKIISYAMTSTQRNAVKIADTDTWDEHTKLLVDFDNQNLLAGNTGVDDIERIIVYRAIDTGATITTADLLTIDDNVDPTASSYIDWTASNGVAYKYFLTFVDSTGKTSELFESNSVTSAYSAFFLIDPTLGTTFRLNLDVDPSRVTVNHNDKVVSSNFSQYATVTKGLTQFDSGTINCWLGYVDSTSGQYVDNLTYLDSFKSVIQNTNDKFLKNRKGKVWRVQTSFNDYLNNPLMSSDIHGISFNFYETGSLHGGDN